jgi:hypothetical protein
MMQETLTIRQAFEAMVVFLEVYYERTHSDDIGALLGDLNTHLWADGITGDPAAWKDWLESVQKVLMSDTSPDST